MLMLRGRLCTGSGGGMMLGIEGIGIGWDEFVRVEPIFPIIESHIINDWSRYLCSLALSCSLCVEAG